VHKRYPIFKAKKLHKKSLSHGKYSKAIEICLQKYGHEEFELLSITRHSLMVKYDHISQQKWPTF